MFSPNFFLEQSPKKCCVYLTQIYLLRPHPATPRPQTSDLAEKYKLYGHGTQISIMYYVRATKITDY